ncbi:MAG: hypothetical protein QW273_00330 [Candidatus Pacearchaeota archaeon]
MRNIPFFLILVFFFFLQSALAECICNFDGLCFDIGDVYTHSFLGKFYCSLEGEMKQQKESGACENDFECLGKCLNGVCVLEFRSLIAVYNSLLNGTKFCIEEGMFCLNSSEDQPENSTFLQDYYCDEGMKCYKCNNDLNWYSSLRKCIRGLCNKSPGCLNETSLNNSEILDLYCSSGRCFSCFDDYFWNSSSRRCELLPCNFIPGCSVSNISNAVVKNRYCSQGLCYSCRVGYVWNNVSRECLPSGANPIVSNSWEETTLSENELQDGVDKTVKEYSRIKFFLWNNLYFIDVYEISISNVKVKFNLEPIFVNQIAYLNDERNYDLNADGIADVVIKNKGVDSSNSKIILNIQKKRAISNNYSVQPQQISPNQTDQDNLIEASSFSDNEFLSKNLLKILLILGIFIAILIISILLIETLKNKKDSFNRENFSLTNDNPSFNYPPTKNNYFLNQ